MASDITLLVNDLSNLITSGIFVFGAFRAVQIGRALVSPTYRNRAFWTAAIMVVFVVVSAVDMYVPFFSSTQDTVTNAFLASLPGTAQLMFLFAFIDSTVLASMETDFFHRDTLDWKRGRKPAYAVTLVCLVVGGTLGTFSQTSSSWVPPAVYGVIFVILGFSVATLIVASRRTPDRTMRRFVRLLGFALGFFVLAVLELLLTPDVLSFDLVHDLLFIIATYLVYKAAISLSPLGRIVKETA